MSYENLLYQIFFDEFLVNLIHQNAQYLNSGNYGADLAKTIVVYCKSGFQDEYCFKDKDNASGFWKTMRNLFLSIIPVFFLSMMLGAGASNGEAEAAESFDFLGAGIVIFLILIFLILIFLIVICSQSYYERKHGKSNFNECATALYYHCVNTVVTQEDYEYLANQNIYFKKICIQAGIPVEKKEL